MCIRDSFCAVVIFWNLRKPDQVIVVNHYLKIRPNFPLIGIILSIGIPSGIENGMFQFGKLAIQSSVSTLGTAAIAAQAMTIILENLNGIGAIGIGIGLMTVVGPVSYTHLCNLCDMKKEEKEAMKEQIALYKKWRKVLQLSLIHILQMSLQPKIKVRL